MITKNELGSMSSVRIAVSLLNEYRNEKLLEAIKNSIVAEAKGFDDPYHFLRDLVREGLKLKRYELENENK